MNPEKMIKKKSPSFANSFINSGDPLASGYGYIFMDDKAEITKFRDCK